MEQSKSQVGRNKLPCYNSRNYMKDYQKEETIQASQREEVEEAFKA